MMGRLYRELGNAWQSFQMDKINKTALTLTPDRLDVFWPGCNGFWSFPKEIYCDLIFLYMTKIELDNLLSFHPSRTISNAQSGVFCHLFWAMACFFMGKITRHIFQQTGLRPIFYDQSTCFPRHTWEGCPSLYTIERKTFGTSYTSFLFQTMYKCICIWNFGFKLHE